MIAQVLRLGVTDLGGVLPRVGEVLAGGLYAGAVSFHVRSVQLCVRVNAVVRKVIDGEVDWNNGPSAGSRARRAPGPDLWRPDLRS